MCIGHRGYLLLIGILVKNANFEYANRLMKFIVKLFPEVTIKSPPVKKRLIQRLQANLKIILQRIDPKIKVRAYGIEWTLFALCRRMIFMSR